MKIKHLSLFLIPILFNACIDPYEVDFNKKNSVFVVEGLLTDDIQSPDTIKFIYSNYSNEIIEKTPVASVKASIVILPSQKEVKLIEYGTGSFLPPTDLKINTSEKYILKFSLPDGQQFESTPETFTPTPSISKIYDKFNPASRLSENGKELLSAHEIFIDFQDTPNQKNYYLWRYIHYEQILHCATCYESLYNEATESCNLPMPYYLRAPYYDYVCRNYCYQIFKGKSINVMSDNLSDGQEIKGRFIAKIPFYYMAGCLVEIQQTCISPETYLFYKILEAQSQTNGGLVDVPPAAIVGNIKNLTNPTKKVIGYFGVANIQKTRYWLERDNASLPYDFVLGHPIIEEPKTQLDPFRPPKAICKQSITRTPFKPKGWVRNH
jgi:Domain of unknown function (DUF4249)